MVNCPCCSDRMLRHISGNRVYFFCPSCWQEMPQWVGKKDCSLPINQVMEFVISKPKTTLAKI